MSSGYWDDVARHVRPADADTFWLAHPLVRARVNRRISGEDETWPSEWLRRMLSSELPLERAVSVGCGAGQLERDLIDRGIVGRIVGVDLAPQPLAHAREARDRAGIPIDRLDYVQGDAREFLSAQSDLDAVFFHGSLHHLDRLDDLMERISGALRPGGILYADEYVGPSMKDWGWRNLFLANLFHNLVSWRVRRVGLVRAPRNPSDPTEMIASSEIVPAIRRRFQVEVERPYGGNLLSLIYPNLRRPGPDGREPTSQEFDQVVRFLLDWEERLLRGGFRSYYTILVARKPARHFSSV